ncbi:prepronociceptin [Passer montanus]|uniref:prepronociceptin n=1 Tax=Passer montanus TaxID=9160 RepID=UPI0019614F75|nr:prepronociceptin [Passer montanus]
MGTYGTYVTYEDTYGTYVTYRMALKGWHLWDGTYGNTYGMGTYGTHAAPSPQICILECEGQAVPRATWELCAATGPAAPRPRRLSGHAWPSGRRDHREEEQQREEDEEEEDIWRRAAAGRAAKGVQKRYGGFIGVRKSARKWNNQKRFSEFLKQYLGMAPRSSEYGRGGGGAGDAQES